MQQKNLIRFLESLVLFPAIAVSIPLEGFPASKVGALSPQIVLSQKANNQAVNLLALNQVVDSKAEVVDETLKAEGEAVDAYFAAKNMPLQGLGFKMATEAQKNNIDWRLLPAIAVRESTGGKKACKGAPHNFFGWGSCKISFSSDEEAIETVALNLGGNNPNTERHYLGKTTKEILQRYNPPSVVPHYANQVMSIMKAIGTENIVATTTDGILANA